MILRHFYVVTSPRTALHSEARPDQAAPRNPPRRRRSRGNAMRQLLLDFDRAPAPTFANFVTGANAELAHALEAATRGSFPDRVLYVWGESGAGKSHLLRAFVNSAKDARYVEASDLHDGDMHGILAVDDVERLGEERQVALFNAFNERAIDFLVVAAGASPRDVAIRRD